MLEIIKKSALITKDNVALTLSLVIYLILMSLLTSQMAHITNSSVLLVFLSAMLVFASMFFSGWFSMLKKSIENGSKKYSEEDDKITDIIGIRTQFFPGVQQYILPLVGTFLLYYLFFALWMLLAVWIANNFLGSINFLFEDLKDFTQTKEATITYLENLPNAKVMLIYSWQMLFVAMIFIYSALTLFLLPALYYTSKNPFLALRASLLAIIKRPLGVLGISAFLALSVLIVLFLGGPSSSNSVLAFLHMVFSIFFTVYVNVLIFSYYEKFILQKPVQADVQATGEPAPACNSGPDGVGENENCDRDSEKN
jgi:hypothetical protein